MENEKNKILILSGGTLKTDLVKQVIKEHKFKTIIAADGGVKAADEMGIFMDYIVGDFDSVSPERIQKYKDNPYYKDGRKTVIKQFPTEKNYTDTHLAIELAIDLGGDSLVILGATGTRFDHTMANIQLLLIPLRAKIKAVMIDEYNKIYLIDSDIFIQKESIYGPFLSLLPMTEQVDGITLKGFKYPLENAELFIGASIGISNEIQEETAAIELDKGILIVVEAKDA